MPNENYVLLERTELNASAASVTFANIPQTGYTDLKIVMSLRSTVGGGTNWDPLLYRFNSSTSGYSTREVEGTGSAAASSSATTATSTAAGGTWGRLQDYGITTSNQTANTFSNIEFYIPNYTSSNQKSGSLDSVYETNATAAYAEMVATLHTGTSSITTLDFALKDGSFAQYSTFSLYGIAAVGTTPAIAPKAYGGNRIDNDGTYWYHTFTSSGAFTPQTGLTCDVLVVAGGGGAGWDTAAGAGGGGVIANSNNLFGATSYTITIGGGGTSPSTSNGTNGSDSTISGTSISLTAKGGGGSATNGGAGINGGSGGGGGFNLTTAGTSTQTGGYGNSGGTSSSNPGGYPTGGGGGGGAVGSNTSGNTSGAGGVGISGLVVAFVDTMGSATSTGQLVSGNYYYAGGGGGGAYGTGGGVRGLGGNGGGGNGTASPNGSAGIAGTVNTGGGGGGGAGGGGSAGGGAGGSGIIIVRYPIA